MTLSDYESRLNLVTNMEVFIEKVKGYPILWDTKLVSYRDITQKDSIWNDLAQECNIDSGKQAKLLWKRLRDSHREAIRRRKQCGPHSGMRPWKYELAMDFLLPGGERGDADTSAATENKSKEETNEEFESETYTHFIESDPYPNVFVPTLKNMEWHLQNQLRDDAPSPKRQKISQSFNTNTDPLMDLFSSLYKKTKKLPKNLNLRVQREIFNAVAKAEEDALSTEASVSVAVERCSKIEPDEFYDSE